MNSKTSEPFAHDEEIVHDLMQSGDVPVHHEAPRKPNRKPLFITIGVVVLIIAAIFGIVKFLHARSHETTDDAFIDAHVSKISPKVAAIVRRVAVDDNQEVRAGDLLVQLDPRDYEAARAEAAANVGSVNGKVAQAVAQQVVTQATLGQARADVSSAQATAENASAELTRVQQLAERRVVSPQDVDNARAAARTSLANVDAARKKEEAALAQIGAADANVKAAEADLEQARAQLVAADLNLSYTKIIAPVDGRVTHRTVENGDYVAPGQALLALTPHDVYVTANFKETQLTHMRAGQEVEIEVDAFPDRKYRGHVDSIQSGTGAAFSLLPPENATGNYVKVVQRLPVKILFNATLDELRDLAPGMSVVPDVAVR